MESTIKLIIFGKKLAKNFKTKRYTSKLASN
jgi:hypothetical protein